MGISTITLIRLLVAGTIILLSATSCVSYVVKPVILNHDKELYKKIQTQKKDLIKKPSLGKIEQQLNDYDTYSNKAYYLLEENNKRAKK